MIINLINGEEYLMSSEKRKVKIIKVDKLIVKADQVIIEEARNERSQEDSRKGKFEARNDEQDRFDPWGFPIRRNPFRFEDRNEESSDNSKEHE